MQVRRRIRFSMLAVMLVALGIAGGFIWFYSDNWSEVWVFVIVVFFSMTAGGALQHLPYPKSQN